MNETEALPVCKICGATVPAGKELCWCCEHGPKLHAPEPKIVYKKADDKS